MSCVQVPTLSRPKITLFNHAEAIPISLSFNLAANLRSWKERYIQGVLIDTRNRLRSQGRSGYHDVFAPQICRTRSGWGKGRGPPRPTVCMPNLRPTMDIDEHSSTGMIFGRTFSNIAVVNTGNAAPKAQRNTAAME